MCVEIQAVDVAVKSVVVMKDQIELDSEQDVFRRGHWGAEPNVGVFETFFVFTHLQAL